MKYIFWVMCLFLSYTSQTQAQVQGAQPQQDRVQEVITKTLDHFFPHTSPAPAQTNTSVDQATANSAAVAQKEPEAQIPPPPAPVQISLSTTEISPAAAPSSDNVFALRTKLEGQVNALNRIKQQGKLNLTLLNGFSKQAKTLLEQVQTLTPNTATNQLASDVQAFQAMIQNLIQPTTSAAPVVAVPPPIAVPTAPIIPAALPSLSAQPSLSTLSNSVTIDPVRKIFDNEKLKLKKVQDYFTTRPNLKDQYIKALGGFSKRANGLLTQTTDLALQTEISKFQTDIQSTITSITTPLTAVVQKEPEVQTPPPAPVQIAPSPQPVTAMEPITAPMQVSFQTSANEPSKNMNNPSKNRVLLKDIEILNTKVAQLETQNSDLRARLDDSQNTDNRSGNELKATQAALDQVSAENDVLHKKVDELNSKLTTAKKVFEDITSASSTVPPAA